MEIMTLQEELASETRALSMLVSIVNQAQGDVDTLTAEAAAELSYSTKLRRLQRALDAKQYRDRMQTQLDKQAGRVRAIRLQIENERMLRVMNLDMHHRLQQIAPAPHTPEAA